MTNLESDSSKAESVIRLELYKSLRSEVAGYVEKVPGLWLQKFLLVGAVIAFLVTNHDKLKDSGDLLIASVLSIPILAVLLDAKIVEYGLHARAISMFIRNSFDNSEAADWESTLWGDKGPEDIVSLVRLRSITTVVVTAVPTIVLIILSGLAIDEMRSPKVRLFVYFSALLSAIYALVTIYAWRRVWPDSGKRSDSNPTPNSSATT
jgi:hypothetical protein